MYLRSFEDISLGTEELRELFPEIFKSVGTTLESKRWDGGFAPLPTRKGSTPASKHEFYEFLFKSNFLGKLGFKNEPAGKVRVFAMVVPWVQYSLKPLHLLLFKILSKIEQDGTFNQIRPIERLLAHPVKRSYKDQ